MVMLLEGSKIGGIGLDKGKISTGKTSQPSQSLTWNG